LVLLELLRLTKTTGTAAEDATNFKPLKREGSIEKVPHQKNVALILLIEFVG